MSERQHAIRFWQAIYYRFWGADRFFDKTGWQQMLVRSSSATPLDESEIFTVIPRLTVSRAFPSAWCAEYRCRSMVKNRRQSSLPLARLSCAIRSAHAVRLAGAPRPKSVKDFIPVSSPSGQRQARLAREALASPCSKASTIIPCPAIDPKERAPK
jgi:hypothetical protein